MNAYIHIPFCSSICSYCDFTSYVGEEKHMEAYASALVREIRSSGMTDLLRTVYFGGGTPSCMPPPLIATVLESLKDQAGFSSDVEVTLEANPETFEPERFESYRKAGVTRLSIGAQASQDRLLKPLGRRHGWDGVQDAVRIARKAGFDNLNLDLMFGLPGQSIPDLQDTVEKTLELNPDHVSLYALQVETGTPLAAQASKGLAVGSDDEQADQYALAQGLLNGADIQQYEVSNFSLPGFECRHNLAVWQGEDYFGFGVSAVGTVKGIRRTNPESLGEYLKNGNASATVECLTRPIEAYERVMLGLRTSRGVDLGSLQAAGVEDATLDMFIQKGLLAEKEGRWAPTAKGFFVLNGILARLLPTK
jgi:oxygen-independent coproporphyrinogen III oxidase